MGEPEPVGVQELPLEAEVARDTVDGVAADRQPDRLEMDANLVRAPRLEAHLEERAAAEGLLHLEPGDGVARRLGVERVTRAVAAVATDRRLDPPGARPRCAQHESEVAALHPSFPDRLGQARVRLLRAGDDQQAGGVAVETVDEPGPLRVPSGGSEREQPVRERRALVRPRGVGDETGGLLDDEQVLVVVDHLQRELDRLELALARELDVELLPTCEPVALRAPMPVDEDGAAGHEPFGESPRPDGRDLGDDGVQPPPRVGLRNAKAVRCQRRRSSGRPPRTRGTGGRLRPR